MPNTLNPILIEPFTKAPQELNPTTGIKLLVYNPQSTQVEHVDWSQLPQPPVANFGTGAIVGTLDTIGDGVKTTWTLPFAAVNKDSLEVIIDGLEDRSFTYNSAVPSISFTSPVPSGVSLYVRIFGGQETTSGVASVAGKTGSVTLALGDIASGVTTNRLLGNTSGDGKPENITPGTGLSLSGGALNVALNADQISDGTAKVMMTVAERQTLQNVGETSNWQDPVINYTSTPPGTPAAGDRYIVQPTGTGAWATHDNAIATWGGSSWSFVSPSPGWVVVVTTSGVPYVFGTNVWSQMAGAVSTVFGRAGAVVATSGDYTAAQITETSTAKIMTGDERTKLATVAANANAAGDTGDAFAVSHDGATGAAHGAATASVNGFMPSGDKTKLDAATAAATASTLALRDANGRLAIATPSAAGDAATKGYVDGLSFPSVGSGVIIPTTRNVTITNSVTPTICWEWTIPANALTTNGDEAYFGLSGYILNNSGTDKTFTIKITLNSVTLMEDASGAIVSNANARLLSDRLRIWRVSSTTARGDIGGRTVSGQTTTTTGLGDFGGNAANSGTLGTADTAPSGIDWTIAQTLTITITLSAADANYTFKSYEGAGFVFRQAGGIFALDSASVPAMSDNTNSNVSTSAHGFAPKAPNDALFKALSVQSGTIAWSEVSATGGGEGTTLASFADDPTLGTNDDVVETYLGKRVTLPASSAGKRNRITVVNAGTATATVRANNTASLVQGARCSAGTTSNRFALSNNAPGIIGNKITVSMWLRVQSDTVNKGILHFGNGVEDSTTTYFRISATYATNPYLQVESKNANTVTLLRRYAFTRGIMHHVVISIDLGVPSIQVAVDGLIVTHDAGQAGTTLTSAQPVGGASQPVRWLSKVTSVYDSFTWTCAQLMVWLNAWSSLTEERIRQFYNDGPCSLTASTTVNGTTPLIAVLANASGAPATVANAGSLGGTFTDGVGSGIVTPDVAGLDSPILEQIDGYPHPTGYLLPVGQEVRLIRRATKGVWGVF